MKKNQGSWDKALGVVLLTLFALACLIPILAVVGISFSSEVDISLHGYSIIPRTPTANAYKFVLDGSGWQIGRSYLVTIIVTVVGTTLSLFCTSLMAFAISRPDFAWRRPLAFIGFFTMLFNGGLVPTYMVVTQFLGLQDNILALILPYVLFAWNLLVMKTFFQNIPFDLYESAKIDGLGNFMMYAKITVPLGKPAFAAIGVLVALRYWNDWWLPLLYINKDSLTNLQFLLYRIMANIQALIEMAELGLESRSGLDYTQLPSETMRMAICMIVAGPMLLVFPFFQKYFARGLTIGSLKG
jgi:putative aldouronate transport system permease protein